MKRIALTPSPQTLAIVLLLAIAGGCASTQAGAAPMTNATSSTSGSNSKAAVAAITETLRSYEAALNASDTDAVMKLYAADGVFMPQHFPSAVGSEQVRGAYDGVFATIKLSVTFDIVEVEQISDLWAFARTNSLGTVKVLATGDGGPEANQELFLLQRVDGNWKIARYAFSSTNPPRN